MYARAGGEGILKRIITILVEINVGLYEQVTKFESMVWKYRLLLHHSYQDLEFQDHDRYTFILIMDITGILTGGMQNAICHRKKPLPLYMNCI